MRQTLQYSGRREKEFTPAASPIPEFAVHETAPVSQELGGTTDIAAPACGRDLPHKTTATEGIRVHTATARLAAGTGLDLPTTGWFWIAMGATALVVLAGFSVRVVSEHERMVVSRLGRVVGVRGPGLVLRLPGLERLTPVSLRPVHLPLFVMSTTRDGVQVRLLADGLYRVTDPSRSTSASPDAFGATSRALESGLSKEVARTDLAALLIARERFESQLPLDVTTLTATWGVEVCALEITDIETRLTADLLHGVARQTGPGDR
ncbi:MAG TPA: SPFH domain-containing protein [Actinomycetales bacterium]|nr:SPFH domain-containing protein [Actinomycetales bacterium]